MSTLSRNATRGLPVSVHIPWDGSVDLFSPMSHQVRALLSNYTQIYMEGVDELDWGQVLGKQRSHIWLARTVLVHAYEWYERSAAIDVDYNGGDPMARRNSLLDWFIIKPRINGLEAVDGIALLHPPSYLDAIILPHALRASQNPASSVHRDSYNQAAS